MSLCERDDKKSFGSALAPVHHKLIIGENYDVLKNLLATYTKNGKGLIDVIYIDPPYNTDKTREDGNDYKSDVVSEKFVYRDKFSRTGWLNMMKERLELAKKLLSDKGVIFISIDDNEQAYLKVLCDEIFGENNFVGTLPRITKKSGKDHSVGIAKNHDYLLTYAKSKQSSSFTGLEATNRDYNLTDEYYKERGSYKLNQTLDYDSLWYNKAMDFPLKVGNRTYYPGGSEELHRARRNGLHNPKDWVWRWSKEKFLFGLENGFIVIKQGNTRERIYTKTYLNATISKNKPYSIEYLDRTTLLSSIALTDNLYSNDNGEKEISKLGLSFDFPKPPALIKQLLKIIQNKSAIVLDFFAGSGTTGQAVMELNEEDGGNRQCILVTNNENNIATNVTYERLYRVVNGKGTNGETFSWKYSKDKPYLSDNHFDVFDTFSYELKIDDYDKAKKLVEKAKTEFKKLNPGYEAKDFDIYNQLAALKPYKK